MCKKILVIWPKTPTYRALFSDLPAAATSDGWPFKPTDFAERKKSRQEQPT
jgi:hypothetical protein